MDGTSQKKISRYCSRISIQRTKKRCKSYKRLHNVLSFGTGRCYIAFYLLYSYKFISFPEFGILKPLMLACSICKSFHPHLLLISSSPIYQQLSVRTFIYKQFYQTWKTIVLRMFSRAKRGSAASVAEKSNKRLRQAATDEDSDTSTGGILHNNSSFYQKYNNTF